MESNNVMESNQGHGSESLPQVIYRAVGWVAGTYRPSSDNSHHGVLVTEDGQTIPAQLFRRLRNQLKKKHPDYDTQPDFFYEPARWAVYPQTDPLRFQLVIRKPLHCASPEEADPGAELGEKRKLDEFRMVGEVSSCSGGTVTNRIRRNEQPPKGQEDNPEYQPFVLTLEGSLPAYAVGQIWELEVLRSGSRLVVAAGRPYEPSDEDLACLELKQRLSKVEKPIKSNKHTFAATVAPEPSSTPQPPLPPGKTPDAPTSDPNALSAPNPGKMEVVVKLNQFPGDVKTVDSGWKEFEVNTGDCIVTITVKPKAFAALEQAKLTYPLWIAAISGQMGLMSATGFRLEFPAIKVFERQRKGTSESEQTTSFERSSQCLITGKMEVVVKINQFPDDVKTVDKGWKEFEVNTGDCIVAITVKPKVFAVLEQAKLTYPTWVAAISGQMGSATTTGFLLESPAIKVFERKAKDSSQPEQTTSKDNSAPKAKDFQPSPPGKTLPLQQQALPLAESQPQKSPAANPMQRTKENLKQQLKTKTPPHQSQQQREPTTPGKKQPTTSTPLSEPQSGPPRGQSQSQ